MKATILTVTQVVVPIHTTPDGEPSPTPVDFDIVSTIWALGTDGNLWRSTDGGAWERFGPTMIGPGGPRRVGGN